jgi:hypothetical protein
VAYCGAIGSNGAERVGPDQRGKASRAVLLFGPAALLVAVMLALASFGGAAGDDEAGVAGKKADKRDFGDAPDGPAGADYPALKASKGASHKKAGRLRLGGRANKEKDSRQVDLDVGDGGFDIRSYNACQKSKFRFNVNASKLRKKNRGLFKKKNVGDHKVFLNAWFDWNQDLDWKDKDNGCGLEKPVPEWRIVNKGIPLKRFKRKPRRNVTVKKIAGSAFDPTAACLRASLTLDEKFSKRVRVGGQRFRNDGRGTFGHGETEDYCPSGVSTAPGPGDFDFDGGATDDGDGGDSDGGGDGGGTCDDGNDDDADGKPDSADLGCYTKVDPEGTYDGADSLETDVTKTHQCPDTMGESTSTVITLPLPTSGHAIESHVLRDVTNGEFPGGQPAPIVVVPNGPLFFGPPSEAGFLGVTGQTGMELCANGPSDGGTNGQVVTEVVTGGPTPHVEYEVTTTAAETASRPAKLLNLAHGTRTFP